MNSFVLQLLFFFASFLLVFTPRNYLLHSDSYIEESLPTEDGISLYIERSQPMDSVFNTLTKKGVTIDPEIFNWARRLSGWRSVPRGHYLVNNNGSLDQLLEKLGRGLQDPITLTVLPGQNVQSIVQQLEKQSIYQQDDFFEALNDNNWLATVNSDTSRVIGQLYPETYLVYWTDQPKNDHRSLN
jgi:UPF0755 protein